jgi:hypothetical protein
MGGVWRGRQKQETCVKKGRRSKEKWYRKIMYGGAKRGNCRRMKDPIKVRKEGTGMGSEGEVK